MFSTGLTAPCVLLLFSLPITVLVFVHSFFFFLSHMGEFVLINPSAVFVFGDFNAHRKDCLPILVELIDLVNSVTIFLSKMTSLKWLTFLLGSQTAILTALLFCTYFFLLTLVLVLQWLSLHWEILIMLLSQFPLTFNHIHNGIPRFTALLMTILVLIGMVFVTTWEIFHGRISLNSKLLLCC